MLFCVCNLWFFFDKKQAPKTKQNKTKNKNKKVDIVDQFLQGKAAFIRIWADALPYLNEQLSIFQPNATNFFKIAKLPSFGCVCMLVCVCVCVCVFVCGITYVTLWVVCVCFCVASLAFLVEKPIFL